LEHIGAIGDSMQMLSAHAVPTAEKHGFLVAVDMQVASAVGFGL